MRALLITIVAAPLSYLSFGYLNSRLDLARAGGLVNSLIVIFTTAVAVFIFKESLTWMQYLGVGLIVVGIYLMMTK